MLKTRSQSKRETLSHWDLLKCFYDGRHKNNHAQNPSIKLVRMFSIKIYFGYHVTFRKGLSPYFLVHTCSAGLAVLDHVPDLFLLFSKGTVLPLLEFTVGGRFLLYYSLTFSIDSLGHCNFAIAFQKIKNVLWLLYLVFTAVPKLPFCAFHLQELNKAIHEIEKEKQMVYWWCSWWLWQATEPWIH